MWGLVGCPFVGGLLLSALLGEAYLGAVTGHGGGRGPAASPPARSRPPPVGRFGLALPGGGGAGEDHQCDPVLGRVTRTEFDRHVAGARDGDHRNYPELISEIPHPGGVL